jgi:hypothetical protein
VRIDKTQGLGPQELPDAARSTAKSGKPAQPAGDVDGANLNLTTAALLRPAVDTPDVDTDAVEQARQLLKSGQLDSPDACLRAARNMLDKGI